MSSERALAQAPSGAAEPARRPEGQAREFSAGGVVVRGGEVVVIVPDAPRGRRLAGAGAAQGPRRPGRDADAGRRARGARGDGHRRRAGGELGETRYWYRRDGRTIGKSVSFFLFSYLGGDTADHDDEVEEARWIALEQAVEELSHARRARDGGAGDRLPGTQRPVACPACRF